MRKLITFFVNRPVWGNAFIAIVIIFGVFALSTTKKSFFPELDPNTIIVSEDPYDENFYLPIMEERLNDKKSKIYICKNYVCDLPIDNMKDLNEKIDNVKGAYKSK